MTYDKKTPQRHRLIYIAFSAALIVLQSTTGFAMEFIRAHEPQRVEPLRVMTPRFELDQKEEHHFLSKEEMESSRIEIRDGVLYGAKSEVPLKSGHFMYFLTMTNELYVLPANYHEGRGPEGRIFHSSFDLMLDPSTQTGACKMAGEMMIRNDSVHRIFVNHDSGHYRPEFEKTKLVEDSLRAAGYAGEIIRTQETW